ncbi:MAG: zinc ribbon domain-containing protein [Candidatus Heimdallarchaeota archaeon]|nr:zinc ribbon domain-containing protein [Candidatus Heimdallarchaeota archaeon]
MGYFKGLFTSLGITLPSFIFIHIYLSNLWVPTFFTELFAGNWELIFQVFETTIMEPITIFFVAPNALRILFAFIPWVVTAFVVNFFFRKKHAARLGLATIITIYFIVEIIYYLVIQGTLLNVDTLTQPNPLYGYLVIQAVVTIIGLIAGVISPFKKEDSMTAKQPRRSRSAAPPVLPPQEIVPEPYYMPNTSPSRNEYMDRQQSPSRGLSEPVPCEYCGSFLDPDSEFCSVCGNRAFVDY